MVGTCYIERGELYPWISSFFASVTSLPRCTGTPQQQPNPHRFTYKTNKHQYLLESSCHHNHKKIIIPFRLLLKIRHTCSTDTFFDQRAQLWQICFNCFNMAVRLNMIKVSQFNVNCRGSRHKALDCPLANIH